jgi:subfamily B ATP-binding cassette protein MsbA
VLLVVARIAGLIVPSSTRYLIDAIVGGNRSRALAYLGVVVTCAVLAQAYASASLARSFSVLTVHFQYRIRMRLHRHICTLPVLYFDTRQVGSLVANVMSDVDRLRGLAGNLLVQFLGGVFVAVLAIFLMFSISPWLSSLVVCFIACYARTVSIDYRKSQALYAESARLYSSISGRLAETFGGIRVIKGLRREHQESINFEHATERHFEQVKQTLLAQAGTATKSAFLIGSITAVITILGGYQLLEHAITLGEFFVYLLYLGIVIMPLSDLVIFGHHLGEARAAIDRINETLQAASEDSDRRRVTVIGRINGRIELENVTFSYATGTPILQDVSFAIHPGTITALVGASGAGKSTIIRLIASFSNPSSGLIRVDGIDLTTITLDSYRRQLGLVLQETFLFDGTIRENICLGRPDASSAEVLRAARIANVHEFADRLEHGYDTIVGERGVMLSGGQRQRIAIARALILNPSILLLDEATSSLDTQSELMIREGLSSLMNGRTTLVVAHRLSTVERANEILFLKQGRIVERGTHRELLSARSHYYEMFGTVGKQTDRLPMRHGVHSGDEGYIA